MFLTLSLLILGKYARSQHSFLSRLALRQPLLTLIVRGLINQKRAETTIVNAINFNAVASNVIDRPRVSAAVIIESPCILEATRIDEPREVEVEVVMTPGSSLLLFSLMVSDPSWIQRVH